MPLWKAGSQAYEWILVELGRRLALVMLAERAREARSIFRVLRLAKLSVKIFGVWVFGSLCI